jgi:predicted GNAT family acetyltransferase
MSSYKNKLRNLAGKNYNVVNMGNGNTRLRYRPNRTGTTVVNVTMPQNNEPNTLYIGHGKTRPNLRKHGLGTRMRALVTLAAKLAGYKRMRQYSTYLNKNQKRNYPNAPPSSRIMNKLGFVRNGTFSGPVISYVFEFNTMNNNKLRRYTK